MGGLRRRLRAWSLVWLVCQAAFLSAFVPRDCCAAHSAHAHGAQDQASCHKTAEASHCPMPDGDGAACPMHQPDAKGDDCRLRGTCDGPLAALAHLFSYVGLPLSSTTLAIALPSAQLVVTVAENAVQLAIPPDSPPPRL